MALQDSTVILSVRCDGNLDAHEGYIEHRASVIICIHLAAHAIWCGTTLARELRGDEAVGVSGAGLGGGDNTGQES
ncbi:hypothetical protein T03_10094 [Trichinella britovi]|uniref:Uncharacterized protein n=2 Tax=Trichinella TaxID=6333 RepID=A0A0V1ALA8_TRIBR|nr:hypothetical protein T03_10094 [Trichinella britovi]